MFMPASRDGRVHAADCRKADILFAVDVSASLAPSKEVLQSYVIPKAKAAIDKVQELRNDSWSKRKGQGDGDYDIRVAAFSFSDKIVSETLFEYQPVSGGLVRSFLDELPLKISTYRDPTELSLPFEHAKKKFNEVKASMSPYDRNQVLVVLTDALPFSSDVSAPSSNPYGPGNIYKEMDRRKRWMKFSVSALTSAEVLVIAVPLGNWRHEEGAMSSIDPLASEDLSVLYERIRELLVCFV